MSQSRTRIESRASGFVLTIDGRASFVFTTAEFETIARQIIDLLQVSAIAESSARRLLGRCVKCGAPCSRFCEACRPSAGLSDSE
jgi:hypothetical protein